MNGAEHGEAIATASTPESASLTNALRALQLDSADGRSRPTSKTPERLSASTKNSTARLAMTAGD